MSNISAFYRDKVVFVTGGTGFIGKIVVEKLLRTSEVKQIILLVREKKNTLPEQRIKDLCSSPVFTKLSKKMPNYKDRIKVVEGNLEKNGLDLSAENQEYLRENVNIILHIAATVKFDEEIIKAISINIRGTREVLEIGRLAKNLESFIYVSTAYSNSYQEHIEERVYPLEISPEKILANMEDEKMKAEVYNYSLKWPNTYTFTKALAEAITQSYRQYFPVAVVRPSCVMPALDEPMSGWCDNIYGTNGTFIGWYYGLIRTSQIDPQVQIDTVPVDYVSNSIIAVGWKTYDTREQEKEMLVYNCISSADNPLTFDERRIQCEKVIEKHPLLTAIYRPITVCTTSDTLFRIYSLFLHYLPAFIMDSALKLRGEKARLVSTYQKLDKVVETVKIFTNTTFFFDNQNMRDLYLHMNSADLRQYPCDNRTYSWRLYFERIVPGLKKHFFKEDLNNVRQARAALRRKELTVNSILAIVFGLIVLQLYYLFF
ncbi:fatty acyl-CoA reductase wat-like isoform X3 [Toxorhynchites rutilus septentrionalis]|uniref:fatty acyl-CoA reductase wat-like isoform X3 n=1 Tax=Toxorhynchites rutilus septentrionalis TaxID=329112 RepID=UPI00247AEFC0|nr:fatty acyl-CoA reductase wat-like isoform X3 [Toxorhynchites rutilus septentrionalis]